MRLQVFSLRKQLHGPRHDARRNGRQRADADRRRIAETLLRDGIEPLPQRRQRRACMPQEDLAVAGDLDAAAVALENRDAQHLFQLADRLRHRRLADMQKFGRLHHALLARDLDKGLQMAELDAAVDHRLA